MNGITVPTQYEHLLKKERSSASWEYVEATIRDYVKEHKDVIITLPMFAKASGLSSPNKRISQLVAEGKLSRWRVKTGKPGQYYKYRWNDIPLIPKPDYKRESPVVTRSLGLPPHHITKEAIAMIGEKLLQDHESYSADELKGAAKLYKGLHDTYLKTEEERERILAKKDQSSGTV